MSTVAIFKGKLVKFLAKAGILVPARGDSDRSPIPTPGEMAFNTNSNKLEVYNGSSWTQVGSGTGLSHPTSLSTYESGTNNVLMSGDSNTAIGIAAGDSITTANRNTFYGAGAGSALETGSNNVGIGTYPLYYWKGGSGNIAIGNAALLGEFGGMGGSNNIAIGNLAGQYLSGSQYNIAIGTPGATIQVNNTVAIGSTSTELATATANNQFVLGVSTHRYYMPGKFEGDLSIGSLSGNTRSIKFHDGDETNYVALKAPTTVSANVTWTLPSADGISGQVLSTDGLGILSWSTPSGGGSGNGLVHPNDPSNTFEDTKVPIGLDPIASHNTVIGGDGTGQLLTDGGSNTIYGARTGISIASGYDNTIIGYNAGANITTSNNNVAVGSSALNYADADRNTAVGVDALSSIQTGTKNVGIGESSGTYLNLSSSYNTAINSASSLTNITLNGTVAIGRDNTDAYAIVTDDNDFTLGTALHQYKLPGTIKTDVRLKNRYDGFICTLSAETVQEDYSLYLPPNPGLPNQVLTTDGSGTLSWSTPVDPNQTITTSGYALNSNALNTQTGSYLLSSSDNGRVIISNSGSAVNITVPSGLPVGFNCMIVQIGAGQVTVVASGVTLNSANGLKIAAQHGTASIISYLTDVFNVSGNTTT